LFLGFFYKDVGEELEIEVKIDDEMELEIVTLAAI
jgi:hypothetical protein